MHREGAFEAEGSGAGEQLAHSEIRGCSRDWELLRAQRAGPRRLFRPGGGVGTLSGER